MKESKIEEKKKLSRTTKQIWILACIIILFVIGSYAWLELTIPATKTNILRAGSLSLKLDDRASEGILLENAVPMSETQGKETQEYQFTLTNEANNAVDYAIYLDDIGVSAGETQMQDRYVKYRLRKDNEEKIELLSTLPNKALDTGVIAGKDTITYTLQVWINQETTTDVMGSVLYKKLRIDASQAPNTICSVTTGNATQIGDEITCGTESFYIIEKDATKVKALAKYNLNVGNQIDTSITNGIQNTTSNTAYGNINFIAGNATYEKTTIETYVNNYVTYLKNSIGLSNDTTATLITKEELQSLGCDPTTMTCVNNNRNWLYLTSYWTRSIDSANAIWYITSEGMLTNTNTETITAGVRPVVTIPIADINMK